MIRIVRTLIAMLILAAASAAAGEVPLSGDEITSLLSGSVAVGDNWRQTFEAGGQTLYTVNGRGSQGSWRVEGDRYCSVWPPSDQWTCYDMASGDGTGERYVVWIEEGVSRTEARLTRQVD